MSSRPFFKLFFSDAAGDTLHLSDAEFGSYMLLIGAMWNAGGRLDNQQERLRRVARCSPKVWPRRWACLQRFFEVVDDVWITSPRLLKERRKADHQTAVNKDNGAAGGKAKARNSKKVTLANATKNASRKPSITIAREEREAKASISLLPAKEPGAPKSRPPVPAEIRAVVVEVAGAAFEASYVAGANWNGRRREIVPATTTAYRELKRSEPVLEALRLLRVSVVAP